MDLRGITSPAHDVTQHLGVGVQLDQERQMLTGHGLQSNSAGRQAGAAHAIILPKRSHSGATWLVFGTDACHPLFRNTIHQRDRLAVAPLLQRGR